MPYLTLWIIKVSVLKSRNSIRKGPRTTFLKGQHIEKSTLHLSALAAWVDQLSLLISKHSLISEKIICKLRNVIKFLSFLHNFPLAYPSIWNTLLDFAQLCLLFPLESWKCLPGCLISSKAVFALSITT